MAMSMTLDRKKQLMAQYGPQCWNGNCEGPPKCLLKHPKKQYGLRKTTRSRSSSVLEGVKKENSRESVKVNAVIRPRSNSSNSHNINNEQIMIGANEVEAVKDPKKETDSADDGVKVNNKSKAEVDKAEEAVIRLAVAKSLEEICPYCKVTFPNATEVQLHMLQNHLITKRQDDGKQREKVRGEGLENLDSSNEINPTRKKEDT